MENELLTQAIHIQQKHKEIQKRTGKYFNIFSILKLEAHETRTHSAFLSELLSPTGSHGQEYIFLSLFLTTLQGTLGDRYFQTIKPSRQTRVRTEYYLGTVTDATGGYIDIHIEDEEGNVLLIENKIYAADQNNQLLRYRRGFPNAKSISLLYLTLEGREPGTHSAGTLKSGIDYDTISYKETIQLWLTDCISFCALNGLYELQVCIQQYQKLILSLTNNNPDITMNQELARLIASSEDNFTAAAHIAQSLEEAKRMTFQNFIKDLPEKLESATGLKFSINIPEDFG